MKRLTVLPFLLAAALAAAAETKPFTVYDFPRIWPQHQHLRQNLTNALRRGDTAAMEKICREAVKLMPDDATWHYNLACALAYREFPGAALTELEKSIELGFRDADAIEKDQDLVRIRKEPRFAELVAKARKTAGEPISGHPAPVPCEVISGRKALLTAANLSWDFDNGVFIGYVKTSENTATLSSLASRYGASKPDAKERPLVMAWLSEGTGAGNSHDLYLNRDAGHSSLVTGDFPLLTTVTGDEEARTRGLTVDHPNTRFPGFAVFGNASRARIGGPFWRSLPRASMTDPGLAGRMHLFYQDNQFWVFPAHLDYGKPAIGDCFPAVAPFQFVTTGSSWSDQPYLRTALAASASFCRPTKDALLRRHLLAPTLQWLFRRMKPGIETEEDYLSPAAHPTAFAAADLDAVRVVTRAHALRPEEIPPAVSLTLVNSRLFPIRFPTPGRDYADPVPELSFITPSAVSFILRSPDAERTFMIQAKTFPKPDPQAVYTWRVVHGDVSAVKIGTVIGEQLNTPERGLAQITIDRRALTNRIDIACFAKSNGTTFGAPSFISFCPVPLETRTYRADKQIDTIDYTNPSARYTDPVMALPRSWKDTYLYSPSGRPLGFQRSAGGKKVAEFLNAGERIVERNADGTPKKLVKVNYIPRKTGNLNQPLELTYVDDGAPYNAKPAR